MTEIATSLLDRLEDAAQRAIIHGDGDALTWRGQALASPDTILALVAVARAAETVDATFRPLIEGLPHVNTDNDLGRLRAALSALAALDEKRLADQREGGQAGE